MECANRFCVYWTKNGCRLEEITLDIQGKCNDCTYIEIDDDMLELARQRLTKDFWIDDEQ